MLKSILLPLDESPLAERALIYATALARRSHARIVLVEAVQAHAFPGADPSEAQIQVTEHAEAYLSSVAARLAEDGLPVESHVYYDQPVNAILDAASRHAADLIVMSTHGRSGLGRMLYGSVADRVLRHAMAPVLLVPSVAEHVWPTDQPLSLLVPLDGSELSERAIPTATLLADAFDARLTLLSVIEPPGYPLYGESYNYVTFDEQTERERAQQYLDRQVAKLRDQGRDASATVVMGSPPALIPVVARDRDADLIVMATHGSSGMARLLLGSVATSALGSRHTTVPLLLVRPVKAASVVATPEPPSEALAHEARAEAAAATAATTAFNVRLTAADLDLIERSLKAAAYAPAGDQQRSSDVRALLDRLSAMTGTSQSAEPATAREPVSAPTA